MIKTARNAIRPPHYIAASIALAALFSFLTPTAAFVTDELAYIQMAEAMADDRSFFPAYDGAPEDAPVLTRAFFVAKTHAGRTAPQYPAGYGIVAAPFVALFGVHGLILMNALAAVAALWLVWRLADRMYGAEIARAALLLAGFAAYTMSYAFAIWPHTLSLLCITGAAALAYRAGAGLPASTLKALSAGALFGLGLFFRIEAIFYAVGAFLWLRLVAAPSDRSLGVMLLAGLAPFLLLCSWFNEIKFGAFNPFTYGGGKEGTADSPELYAGLAIAGGAFLTLVTLVDASRFLSGRAARLALHPLSLTALLVLLAVSALLIPAMRQAIRGAYTLVVDIQALADNRFVFSIARNEYGQIEFWGLMKKALVQSLPFLPLALGPIAQALRGHKIRETLFCVLLIAPALAFFSIKAFQGGMTLNMRYFLPVVPFACILCAAALHDLKQYTPTVRIAPFIGLGVLLAFGIYRLLAPTLDRWEIPASLYPQLILAAALLIAMVFFVARPTGAASRSAQLLAGLAIGYAGALSVFDTLDYARYRVAFDQLNRTHTHLFPEGSLVLTQAENALVNASLSGVHVYHFDNGELKNVRAAIAAYMRAGRCVYIHGVTVAVGIGSDGLQDVSPPDDHGVMNHFPEIYAPAALPRACKLPQSGGGAN